MQKDVGASLEARPVIVRGAAGPGINPFPLLLSVFEEPVFTGPGLRQLRQ